MKLYLASTSPRRAELLKRLNVRFEIIVPSFNEKETSRSGRDEALYFATEKAKSVEALCPDALVIGCDTLVECLDQKLGKPNNEADARRMLELLSGKTHQVHSGIVLLDTVTQEMKSHVETTWVTFKPLTSQEIDHYIQSREPFGKAGAYAIQGLARSFIKNIEGEEESVIGLPLRILRQWLKTP